MWAKANVETSRREDSCSEEPQRDFTRDEVKKCVAELKNREVAAADARVNEIFTYA